MSKPPDKMYWDGLRATAGHGLEVAAFTWRPLNDGAVEYARGDRITQLEAQLSAEREQVKRLREALQLIFNLPKEQPHLDGSDWYDEAQVIAKHALSDTHKLDDHTRMAFGEDA